MNAAQLQPGDYIGRWHQTFSGAKPQSEIVYARVIKVGKATVTIRGEYDDKLVRKTHRQIEASWWQLAPPATWHPEISASNGEAVR